MRPTLVLDLDGTLVDSVQDLAAALNRLMAARALPPFTVPEVTAMVGDGARALVERALAARGQPFGQAALDAFLADYTDHAAVRTRPFPGAVEALRMMRDQGWRLAVCTNKPVAAARNVLDALGLSPLLAAIGGGDSFPARKPDPAHLLGTLASAGGTPAAAVMVGDHHNDIAAATAAGVPSIFAAWGYGAPAMAHGASAICASFGELPAAAARLLSPPGSLQGESARRPAVPSPG